jgi:hypothetical protein
VFIDVVNPTRLSPTDLAREKAVGSDHGHAARPSPILASVRSISATSSPSAGPTAARSPSWTCSTARVFPPTPLPRPS